jgi:gentisate 1,2-dioxygenase
MTSATSTDATGSRTVSTAPESEPDVSDESPELQALYQAMSQEHLMPLWTQRSELMPVHPQPAARVHTWRWRDLYRLAEESGHLVPVGRGGERRAIALANPGLGGMPYATPTLWAAIQYLGPAETAPEHRHTQNAFRFVLEGEGVWTVVDGDPVRMSRGDFLLTPGWHFHGHQNVSDSPMAWLDGLDIPFVHQTDSAFFDPGSDTLTDLSTPALSRSERLWAYPGLAPVALLGERPSSPIAAYRWEHTDRALTEQLEIAREGHDGALGTGHAAVRFTNPTSGRDVMPTIRAEFHRLEAGARSAPCREVGSSVWQVFSGNGAFVADGVEHTIEQGDLFVIPSWVQYEFSAGAGLDLFRFSDTPIYEALGQYRKEVGPR